MSYLDRVLVVALGGIETIGQTGSGDMCPIAIAIGCVLALLAALIWRVFRD